MARRRREKKRDLSHHERYAEASAAESAAPVDQTPAAAPKPAPAVGEAAYLKKELIRVLAITLIIAAMFATLYTLIDRSPWLDSFISELKIG